MKACPTVQGEARLCPSIARSSVQSTPCPRPCSTKPRLPKVCPRASLFPRNTSDQSARLKEISTQAAPCKASHTPRTSLRERAPESGTCPGPTGPNALRAAQSCAGAKPRPSDRRARLSKAFLAQASRLNKDPPSRGALTPQAPPSKKPFLTRAIGSGTPAPRSPPDRRSTLSRRTQPKARLPQIHPGKERLACKAPLAQSAPPAKHRPSKAGPLYRLAEQRLPRQAGPSFAPARPAQGTQVSSTYTGPPTMKRAPHKDEEIQIEHPGRAPQQSIPLIGEALSSAHLASEPPVCRRRP